jgi:hypothetical protein
VVFRSPLRESFSDLQSADSGPPEKISSSLHFAVSIAASITVCIAASRCRFAAFDHPCHKIVGLLGGRGRGPECSREDRELQCGGLTTAQYQ